MISEFHEGPLLHFFCCEVSSLIRSTVVWNIMMVCEAFCKSIDGRFSRSTACREGKFESRISVYFRKNPCAGE